MYRVPTTPACKPVAHPLFCTAYLAGTGQGCPIDLPLHNVQLLDNLRPQGRQQLQGRNSKGSARYLSNHNLGHTTIARTLASRLLIGFDLDQPK
jgi:hypothetical protein